MVMTSTSGLASSDRASSSSPSGPCDIPLTEELQDNIEKFLTRLHHSSPKEGSYSTAREAALILRKIVAVCKWQTAKELIALIKREGRRITKTNPADSVFGNIVRRILKIIREEYVNYSTALTADGAVPSAEEPDVKESLHNMFVSGVGRSDDYNRRLPKLKDTTFKGTLLEAIGEFLSELETSGDNIAVQALEHIHSNEIILTIGKSRTVEAFLKHAAKKRKFHVIVAEAAPFFQGHIMAKSLAENTPPIPTTLITDSAIFAMMSRVNKVIIGTHTVMANGGLKAVNGSHTIALAAKHYSVPLIVCAAMFKLSPQYLGTSDQDAFNKFVTPEDVMNYAEGEVLSKVHLVNPVFDYVPPQLVTLFISNIGGNAPSYVYRLLTELYHPDDDDDNL
ncbi:hypothetical protein RvY_18950 [Ramazzottius varieornatus]|uniref:Translation initiation factor eIF2B subunit beta n=1 Tax=Ramazzottius varieornatus TaxID=947166 RepID=A0A1D1W905_RAMVA|nr:hypothetical protein RvY_18950 [Ramazzottius varieornatus]